MATPNRLSDGKLKVLFILDAFPDPQAGTEGQFWLLFNSLDRTRIEPSILLLRHSQFLEQSAVAASVRVLDVERLRSLRNLRKILAAVRWAKREGFAVAHVFFNDSALVFPLPLSLAGIRVIVSRRDLAFWYTKENLPWLRLNVRFVNAVIANCEAVKRAVVNEEHYPKEKVHVIYNGITRNLHESPGDVRSHLGLPDHARLLVLVANLRPLKRIGDAVSALGLLRADFPDVHLVIVGEDHDGGRKSQRDELNALAASLGIAGRVHFTGKMSDPMPLIRAAEVCLLTSETEGLSNSIIEYMLAGKPVVCTNAGGNAELVKHQCNGYVTEIGDVAAIAAALRTLLDNAELRRSFGEQASALAHQLFDPKHMVVSHQLLYRSLAGAAAG